LTEEKRKLENQVEELQSRCNDLDQLKQELKAVTAERNELAKEKEFLRQRTEKQAKCEELE
jgi:regulator of replication initiation timing